MIKNWVKEDYLTGGHAACAGCLAALGLKLALKALRGKAVVINASGCMTLLTVWPHTPLRVPWIHSAIENAGATASGVYRALKRLGKHRSTHVLVYAGDGATYDIGLQSLSGAIERGDDFLYICYNNESFSNTGVQGSSATPRGAITTTTPRGKERPRKNLEEILAAHNCYVATATLAYFEDYMRKVQKGASIEGPAFIDLLQPCTTGWGFSPELGIEISRLAVQTGVWELYEIVDGKKRITVPKGDKDPSEYFKLQKRFASVRTR